MLLEFLDTPSLTLFSSVTSLVISALVENSLILLTMAVTFVLTVWIASRIFPSAIFLEAGWSASACSEFLRFHPRRTGELFSSLSGGRTSFSPVFLRTLLLVQSLGLGAANVYIDVLPSCEETIHSSMVNKSLSPTTLPSLLALIAAGVLLLDPVRKVGLFGVAIYCDGQHAGPTKLSSAQNNGIRFDLFFFAAEIGLFLCFG